MLLALLPTVTAGAWAQAPDTVAAVHDVLAPIARLVRRPPAEVAFAEARFSPLLARPLVVSGTLSWEGGMRLRRHVDTPFVETTLIDGDVVRMHRAGGESSSFSLDRAPPLKALAQSLVALLSGNRKQLKALFSVQREKRQDTAVWTLVLTPRSSRLARQLAHITLDGDRQGLRCLELVESGGASSIDLLGALAPRMPAQPTRAALKALCRHAH